MARAVGIGGIFFRAKDPAGLSAWYETHLGINPAPTDMTTPPWIGERGVTVFAPFASDTDYFPAGQQCMVNFRVDDMDSMVKQLTGAGVEIRNDVIMEGLGRFVHISDPEGNAVELWEPVQERSSDVG